MVALVRWWPRREKREQPVGDDPLVQAALLLAQGGAAAAQGATAALEVACGLWQRAFASATVSPATPATAALTPRVLGQMGRALVLRGESVHLLAVEDGGRVRLIQAATWDVRGGFDEATWRYRVDLPGPSRVTTRNVPSASVVHARYSTTPAEPWRGSSPLAATPTTAALALAIDKALRVDFDGPSGRVFFVGGDEDDNDWLPANSASDVPNARDGLLKRLNAMRGGVAIASSNRETGSGLGLANDRPVSERLGAEPPREVGELRAGIGRDVLSACGVPPAMWEAASAGAQRESYRQFVFATVLPIASLVGEELSAKLDAEVTLRFDALSAADVVGRSRAYRSLVDAGMAPERAGEVAGVA